MASRDTVPDSSFSATSEYDNRYLASNGRMNGDLAWGPNGNNNPNDYLQIDLGYDFIVCAVATQGNPNANEWATKYKIDLSLDGIRWETYQENSGDKVCFIFQGNPTLNYWTACFYRCSYP